jgi:hypothetical protein
LIKDLQNLKNDFAFAGVRVPEALAKLSVDEQRSWQALWGEVATLLKAVQADLP